MIHWRSKFGHGAHLSLPIFSKFWGRAAVCCLTAFCLIISALVSAAHDHNHSNPNNHRDQHHAHHVHDEHQPNDRHHDFDHHCVMCAFIVWGSFRDLTRFVVKFPLRRTISISIPSFDLKSSCLFIALPPPSRGPPSFVPKR